MLPLWIIGPDDEEPRTSWLTLCLAAACAAAFAWQWGQSDETLLALAFHPTEPWPWAVLTSSFLHADLRHLGGNLIYLVVFGAFVERRIGPLRLAVLYLLTMFAADGVFALWSALEGQTRPCIGASGAISGVMGFTLFVAPKARVAFLWFFLGGSMGGTRSLPRVTVWLWVAVWVFLQVPYMLLGAQSGVAWTAHLGGLGAGVALAAWAQSPRRSGSRWHVEHVPGDGNAEDEAKQTRSAIMGEAAAYLRAQRGARRRPDGSRRPARSLFERPPSSPDE